MAQNYRKEHAIKKAKEENSVVKHKDTSRELTPSMLVSTVKRKDPTKTYGQFGSKKFFCIVSDGHVDYKAMFDATHEEAFAVGDQIGFESDPPDENGFYRVGKKKNICNLTRINQVQATEISYRPKEELDHLLTKCEKRLSEIIKRIETKPPVDLFNKLQQEKRQINKVIGVIHFVQSGLFPNEPERDPREAYRHCKIVTRYLGQEDLPMVLERAEQRMKTITAQMVNYKESTEYNELNRFIIILRWVMDKATTHTHIALHFNLWLVFYKQIKDDYDKDGIFRDEYLTKERRQQDVSFLMEDAEKVTDEIRREQQTVSLAERFAYLGSMGFIDAEKTTKSK